MRDNYVGDIGDFANNGLLRVLCGTPEEPVPGMKLGIIWYRNQAEDHQGKRIGYLKPSESNDQTYRACDEELYTVLQRLVSQSMARNQRLRIRDIIGSPIFPCDTQHYPEPLPDPPTVRNRREWFDEAIRRTADSDLIFINPDTGIKWNQGWSLPYVYTSTVAR